MGGAGPTGVPLSPPSGRHRPETAGQDDIARFAQSATLPSLTQQLGSTVSNGKSFKNMGLVEKEGKHPHVLENRQK